MAHHRHDVPMAARPRAQDAKTILGVVVGYSLDETRQHFTGVRLRTRADHCISKLGKIRQRLPFEAGGRAFSLREQLIAPVTKLPHRPKIHENTLILTRRALKQSFEFSTVVLNFSTATTKLRQCHGRMSPIPLARPTIEARRMVVHFRG
jgi:hypothetical protein